MDLQQQSITFQNQKKSYTAFCHVFIPLRRLRKAFSESTNEKVNLFKIWIVGPLSILITSVTNSIWKSVMYQQKILSYFSCILIFISSFLQSMFSFTCEAQLFFFFGCKGIAFSEHMNLLFASYTSLRLLLETIILVRTGNWSNAVALH